MKRDWGVDVENITDLSAFAQKLDGHFDGESEILLPTSSYPMSLARLTSRYLSLELLKSKRDRLSNWERLLTQSQLNCTLFRFYVDGQILNFL